MTNMFLLNIFALFNLIIIVSQCRAMGGKGQKLGLVYCNIYEKSKNMDAFTPHARQRSRGGKGGGEALKLPLHNVLFVQYVFLPTEQAYMRMYVIMHYLCTHEYQQLYKTLNCCKEFF